MEFNTVLRDAQGNTKTIKIDGESKELARSKVLRDYQGYTVVSMDDLPFGGTAQTSAPVQQGTADQQKKAG